MPIRRAGPACCAAAAGAPQILKLKQTLNEDSRLDLRQPPRTTSTRRRTCRGTPPMNGRRRTLERRARAAGTCGYLAGRWLTHDHRPDNRP